MDQQALWAKIEALVADGYSGPAPVPVKLDPNVDAILGKIDLTFKTELTQARLKELLHYDPETGILTWKIRPSTNGFAKIGGVAGHEMLSRDGQRIYVQIKVNGISYQAHRLIWLYVHGYFPDAIDHIDRDGTNNRLSNLFKIATPEAWTIQQQNVKLATNNTSGCRGVCWDKRSEKWLARITIVGKRMLLGYFSTLTEAIEARQAAERKFLGCLAEELQDPKNRQRQEDTMTDDITMKEKKAVLDNDRKVRATFHSIAAAELDLERRGRYSIITKPTIAGSDPTVNVPKQPANSHWSHDPVPMERPLGYRIDDMECVGEPHEILRSLASSVTVTPIEPDDAAVSTSPPKSVADGGAGRRSFRRRI